jgi:hypothetical protein
MLVSTFLNVVFIPVLYVVVRSMGRAGTPVEPASDASPS